MFFLGVLLSLVLPVVFLTVTESMLDTVSEKRKDLYGEFSDCYYGRADGGDVAEAVAADGGSINDQTLAALLGEEAGKVTRAGSLYGIDTALLRAEDRGVLETILTSRQEASVNFLGGKQVEGLLAAGYSDGEAKALGRLRLLEGEWPGEGQAVLTAGLQKELSGAGIKSAVGDTLSFGGVSYEVSGVLYDYGMLWVSNVNQTESDRLLPELLLSGEDFASLAGETETVIHRTLLDTEGGFSGEVYKRDYHLVQNLGLRSGSFSVPPFVLAVLYLCSALLLAQILLLGLPRLEQRMKLYHLLGVEAGKLPGLFYLDLSWIFLLSLVPGLALGLGLGYVLCRIGAGMFGTTLFFHADIGKTAGVVLTVFLIMAASGLPAALRLRRTRLFQNRKRGRIFSGICFSLLVFGLFFLFGASRCYVKADEQLNLSVPLYGKLPTDYDYEFLAGVISNDTSYTDENGNYVSLSVMEPDDVMTVYNEPYLGMKEEDLEALREADGVRKVSAYKECTQLLLPLDREDPYQRMLEDEMITGLMSYREEVNRLFGLEEAYLESRLQGYSEEELLSLSPYVEEGRIDPDKIRSGEEVILMVPDLRIETVEYDDGTGSLGTLRKISYLEKGQYSGEKGEYSDRYYHPGDTVTLTRLYSENSGLRGFVKEETARKEVLRQDITVKIGAVIRCRTGWFEKTITPDPYMNFLCLNETFDAIGLSSTYTRVRVYGSGEDDDLLLQAVYRLSGRLPEMRLENRAGAMEEYRQYHLLLGALEVILTILSVLMGGGMLLGRLLMEIRENRKKTGLYAIAGVPRGRLFFRFIRPVLLLVPVMWGLSMGAISVLADRFYGLDGYWGPGWWFCTFLAALAVLAVVLLTGAKGFFQESIGSLIRGED